jgi:site-specific DNA-methyltransferase (cytosine-N4-specific)
MGIKPHPARFPIQLPTFFVRFLTDPGDIVLDPFAGSNTTGEACERERRRWITIEIEKPYLEASRFRFQRQTMTSISLVRNGEVQPVIQQELLSVYE